MRAGTVTPYPKPVSNPLGFLSVQPLPLWSWGLLRQGGPVLSAASLPDSGSAAWSSLSPHSSHQPCSPLHLYHPSLHQRGSIHVPLTLQLISIIKKKIELYFRHCILCQKAFLQHPSGVRQLPGVRVTQKPGPSFQSRGRTPTLRMRAACSQAPRGEGLGSRTI